MVRIILAIDVDVKSPESAYQMVYQAMGKLERDTHGIMQWESTDEWYDHNGEPIPEEQIQQARMTFLASVD